MIKIFVYGERAEKENYARALEGCGAQGVFSLDLSLAKDCHGLLLPGGGDIDPSRYGQAPAGSEEPDLPRDAAELELTADFLRWERPILGICRGIQMLNVALGGDLIQDIPTAQDHRHDPVTGDRVHRVTAKEGSFLHQLYGPSFAVNSSHHQALGKLAPNLHLAATSEKDGVIEAVEWPEKRVYGVQWHPERMSFALRREDTVDGKPIFDLFLKQCGM
ncbi:MAG: gamma-glutamyl-gamma-aminobutyrate hydrolase family protein [Acutalibacter sp.]|jgi:putative glutamine amidotransferase